MSSTARAAEEQALKPAAERLLASARRREREDAKRARLARELREVMNAPLIARKKRARREGVAP